MRRFKSSLTVMTMSLALAAGIVDATATSAVAAQTVDPNSWYLCKDANVAGNNSLNCLKGSGIPWRVDNLKNISGGWNDTITSIKTNGHVIETWNDAYFQGTYGRFAEWGTWNQLTSPYQDEISSFSTPN